MSSGCIWKIWTGVLLAVVGATCAAGAAPLAATNALGTNWIPAGATDLLQFMDGSGFHGKLRSMNPAVGVEWEHPDAKAPIDFTPTNLAWIRFEKAKAISLESQPSCRFRFYNGDEIFGNLSAVDEQKLELQSGFGGPLQAPRAAVQSITFLSKGFSMLYEGPSNAEGWILGKNPNAWEYKDGTLIASGAGTIGRNLNLSGSCSVAFDLAWAGQFGLIVTLYTSVLDRVDYSTSFYMFYISPGYISLQRVQGGAGAINLGQASIAEMGRKNRLHLEIRANKEDSTIGLFVDDRLVQRWKDGTGFIAQGSGIVFFSQIEGPSVRISNIKAAHWEGELGMESSALASSKEDLIYLVNHDKVAGRLRDLRNGTVSIAAGQNVFDIPLSRVSQITMATTATNAAPASPWELRAYFAGGGTVAFDLAEWKQGHVSGKSSNFGDVLFDSQAIRQLQFNLQRPKRSSDELESLEEEVWDVE